MKQISRKAELITSSLTRQLFNLAKGYDDVIDLTLGDPDLPCQANAKDIIIKKIDENKVHYSANAGLPEARQAIANKLKKDFNLSFDPNNEIIVTVGGMEALYLSLMTILNAEDEVIVFSPYYVNYVQMIHMCGAVPIIIDSYDNNFYIDKKIIVNRITNRTKAIIINNPCNPTGEIFSKEQLDIISSIAEKYDLYVISDEVYRTLIYDNIKHNSILDNEYMKNRTIYIDSLSKEFSMTGWRIGFAVGPEFIIKNMSKFQENIAACAPVLSQYVLIDAYNNYYKSNLVDTFEKRRNVFFDELSKCEKIKCNKPKATFYMFVDISSLGIDAYDFSIQLLKQKHVAVVPGQAYGDKYNHYIRIAFTKDEKVLIDAAKKIIDFVNSNF